MADCKKYKYPKIKKMSSIICMFLSFQIVTKSQQKNKKYLHRIQKHGKNRSHSLPQITKHNNLNQNYFAKNIIFLTTKSLF